jgi:hypothetical protein
MVKRDMVKRRIAQTIHIQLHEDEVCCIRRGMFSDSPPVEVGEPATKRRKDIFQKEKETTQQKGAKEKRNTYMIKRDDTSNPTRQ